VPIDADLLPFYGPDSPFAVDLVRLAEADSTPFRGVLNEVDEEAMQGFIVGAASELRWPTSAVRLREGDTVDQVDAEGATVRSFRVARDGRRVLDGRESMTYLTESE